MLDDAQIEKLLTQAGKLTAAQIKTARAYATENKISLRDAIVK